MFALAIAAALGVAPSPDPCAYDRERLLAMDQNAFDEDATGGWRALAQRPKCERIAADLVRDYREAHHSSAFILFWHEGQLRADVGQTDQAIALFDKARQENDSSGWNLYVDGTTAFLKHDRTALLIARNKLALLPRPAHLQPILLNGQSVPLPWPPNLNVLDGLLKCFGRPYSKAYAQPCTEPFFRVVVPDR
jgi:hypothetical protein